MHVALTSDADGCAITPLTDAGVPSTQPTLVTRSALAAAVARLELQHPRWVWDDTTAWYPALLAAGVRVERCVDLRLSHAILRRSELTASSQLARAEPSGWDFAPVEPVGHHTGVALFEFAAEEPAADATNPVREFRMQREAIASAPDPNRIGLLLAAESAGALVASEMQFAGLPWRADLHDQLLTSLLGPRPRAGERPALLEAALQRVRDALQAPELNPDSPPDLLKALGRVGLVVASTRSWELKKLDHPAIPPLLEYKKLSRLLAANGWHWLDANVADGRFRPDYVVGGVVTGRWASKGGGGALQLPKQIRGAVVADPGWKLVVADASQLEPRILAALSGDARMAEAGREKDMYAGILASGAVATRAEAKVAMLGAMYGATTGESGRLMPKLTRAYPSAIGLVEDAARRGERGEIVTTRLGRSSPHPGAAWHQAQSQAYGETATDADRRRARGEARSWGRFTRNFIVQGTAAEWALCWMASLRGLLRDLGGGAWLTDAPHLVFFVHDEIVVHCPATLTDAVIDAVQDAASRAAVLLFGRAPVQFPLSVAVVDNYAQAK
ncbi:bifunctional 3'-5' exonuclease/DNA polymerase [Parafrigoribacterium mesophilum]|uniref:bifunctional 3'-5' exonuclease/DNA polymerase n=1 Tax=Parafrigoribacterium mesophilum TaxID=433646 RepID=UPI003D156F56